MADTAPIQVVADEARKLGVSGDPHWFMLGYIIGRAVSDDRTLLTDEERLRRHVEVYASGTSWMT